MFSLRSITLGNKNVIGNDANGVYMPLLRSININLDNYRKQIDKYRNVLSPDEYSNLKINSVFEVIYHEYGHHIAASYLNNEVENTPT